MRRNKPANSDSVFFWDTAGRFLNTELPDIRRKSRHTVASYRASLNIFIDYLEKEKSIKREYICFNDFRKENLKEYLTWMSAVREWSGKTCNLRMTAIRSLLSYAAEESPDIMPLFVNSKTIRGMTETEREIEYFEEGQLQALLGAPDPEKKTGRRNRMLLILGYDAALRVSELTSLRMCDLHLNADVPYITVQGKGEKYRNIPLMGRTVKHLRVYIGEFHCGMSFQAPVFYATTHGIRHRLSDDSVQVMLKKYAGLCRDEQHMPDKVHFHMLRKTRAMELYQAGCPLPYIQQLLGHRNLSTTSGFYAFATLKTLADAMDRSGIFPSCDKKIWKDNKISGRLYRL